MGEPVMDDRTARLECLKLAVAIAPRGVNDPAQTVEEIASRLYNHINSGDAPKPSLTAQVEKQAPSPTRKR